VLKVHKVEVEQQEMLELKVPKDQKVLKVLKERLQEPKVI
jgi:hypothetical protein